MAKRNKGLIEDRAYSTRAAIIFFLVGLAGIGAIIAGKLEELNQFVVTAVPIGLMLFYALLLQLPGLRLRDDQSGDNLYYLGFLYTLASIAVSLFQFKLEGNTESIVTNFGIAIFTTIVGLMLRIAFNQMRGDPADVERTARLELAEASRRMRTELDNAVLELKQFQRATLQSTHEGFSTMSKISEETFRSLVNSTESNSRDFQKSAEERTQVFADNSSKLNQSLTQTAKALEKVGSQLDLFKSPISIIQVEMGPALERFETLIGRITTSQEQYAERAETAFSSMANSAGGISELVGVARTILTQTDTVIRRLNDLEAKQQLQAQEPNRTNERRPIWDIFGDRQNR